MNSFILNKHFIMVRVDLEPGQVTVMSEVALTRDQN